MCVNRHIALIIGCDNLFMTDKTMKGKYMKIMEMTLDDYVEFLGLDFERMVDGMRSDGGFTARRMFKELLHLAQYSDVEIIDKDEVDYKTLLNDIYHRIEKKLS